MPPKFIYLLYGVNSRCDRIETFSFHLRYPGKFAFCDTFHSHLPAIDLGTKDPFSCWILYQRLLSRMKNCNGWGSQKREKEAIGSPCMSQKAIQLKFNQSWDRKYLEFLSANKKHLHESFTNKRQENFAFQINWISISYCVSEKEGANVNTVPKALFVHLQIFPLKSFFHFFGFIQLKILFSYSLIKNLSFWLILFVRFFF